MESDGGAVLHLESDNSIFVSGPNQPGEQYELTYRLRGPITGVRIEAIPDSRLPVGGSGRAPKNGNFHVARFEVAVANDRCIVSTAVNRNIPAATPSTVSRVRSRLRQMGIKAEVTGRPKHLWSIYEKMVLKGREFEEIFDLVGVRVVVESTKDCYAALGTIHSLWAPVAGRFKDYIAMPKFNLYQSLHTTLFGPNGIPIEVQIRTHGMHAVAESGVAAHFNYKAADPSGIHHSRCTDRAHLRGQIKNSKIMIK